MKINYNSWFYKTHKYLTSLNKDGIINYNDTKWVPMNDRYKRLIELESELSNEQPFGIVGNKRGFDKLISLLEESNYSFEDINDSLIETYKNSLTNAMSKMVVNTHAVMFKCSNNDRRYVSNDKFSHYYIVEAPFNQLHFGDRDEFIRQQIDKMHTTENDKYIPITDFNQGPYVKLLGFTILCTVNGFICNDCQVALDDKGFKFKIGWPFDYKNCDFIIYKFDDSLVHHFTVNADDIISGKTIGIDNIGINDGTHRCLVNIYDKNFIRTGSSVPNFGTLSSSGLKIINIQQRTLDNIELQKSKTLDVVVYSLKYFNEVPNVYPAVNYYDIVDTRRVFTETEEKVTDEDGKYILSSSTTDVNELEICTPPIVLDRPVALSFRTIVGCLSLRENMMKYSSIFQKTGMRLSSPESITNDEYFNTILPPLQSAQKDLSEYYKTYLEGSMLTSLVSSEKSERFENFMTNLNNFVSNDKLSDIQRYGDFGVFPELYGNGYADFVSYVTSPFNDNILGNFSDISKISNNYFVMDNSMRFNRPVSEQCFITLKYNRKEGCWLFDVPDIKHFKGIGNSFYIDSDLKGDEVFKFFVLYTDTDSPSEINVSPLSLESIFDFDTFSNEVRKHMGYIRYWNAENKLMKLSKIIYNEYDGEKSVQVMSKILKRKLEGKDIIDIYPTEMNYEPSNITSDNWKEYDENTDRAPFAINFLFYTISLMNENEDKLQSYFYKSLTDRLYNNRYSDIDVSSVIDRTLMFPVNYSKISISPTGIDMDASSVPITNGVYAYYGIPYMSNQANVQIPTTPYRYVFNVYEDGREYPLITENNIDNTSYVGYVNAKSSGYQVLSFRNDILITKMITKYLSYCYDAISYIQTDYQHPYNMNPEIETYLDSITKMSDEIIAFYDKNIDSFNHPSVSLIVSLLRNNAFLNYLSGMETLTGDIEKCEFNGRTKTIQDVTNELLKIFHNVYINNGFDDGVVKRTRNLYLHLKEINTCQSPYQFLKWVENLDTYMISKLDDTRSLNENKVYGNQIFGMYYTSLENYKQRVPDIIRQLKTMIDGIVDNMSTHFNPIVDFCGDIINNYIFDMFIIDDIEFNIENGYDTKPYVMTVDLTSDDRLHPPVGAIIDTNPTLIFQPIVELVNGKWHINNISKICEYAFFTGTKLTASFKILDNLGNIIDTISGTISFVKIGSSADDMIDFNQLPNVVNTPIDIENIHEEYEVNDKNLIVNKKFAEMNYELLIGNRFTQLDHTSELVLQPKTWLQGSIDRLYLPGYMLNKLTNREFGQHSSFEVYFKPSQVLHIPIDSDGSITSVGGKYFIGQTLYLVTDDNKRVFPIIVTAVDYSSSNGFVEAVVDSMNSKWFKISDMDEITRYLNNNITCTVIDDNISNFLDEFSNSGYSVYQIPEYNQNLDPSDEDNPDMYSMPGDPLFVTSNSHYVYTRLNYIFNDLVPNRFIDNNPQNHHMIYVGSSFINNENDHIKIKLINHSFEQISDPENYPILRQEPDDHFIWAQEKKMFKKCIDDANIKIKQCQQELLMLEKYWAGHQYDSIAAWEAYTNAKSAIQKKSDKAISYRKRVESYLTQLEYPTTWYNVRTYESAIVYIQNGRAIIDPSHISNIRNIPYTDKLNVFLYDWEHKLWISPNDYDVAINEIASVRIGEYDDYKTKNVLNLITITPKDTMTFSKSILVYFSYDKSDVFEDIEINPKQCQVKFKPILSLDNTIKDYDPYTEINIRKHFNGSEKFIFDEASEIKGFSKQGYLIQRPKRSGKYEHSPSIRYCDMSVNNGENVYSFNDFDLYMKLPFSDTTTSQKYIVPNYATTIIRDIDGFIPNQTIKLIRISNNAHSSYDGNISSVMFEAYTNIDEDNKQSLTITNSTLPNYIYGTYICTVIMDSNYPHSGGLISVRILPQEQEVIDGEWIHIPDSLCIYKELPKEFVIVPKQEIDFSKRTTVSFRTSYLKESDDTITPTNDGTFNPYEYYFNSVRDIRYPISDVRRNRHNERLIIDNSLNEDVKLIKSTYLSVCRYARQKIPKDGIINMTGYLPTPLSRNRYEFWVNGRCIRDAKNVKIISPTAIQLCNLKSLRNFECVELVDDINDSELMVKGPIYVDLNGKTYASHKLAIMSGNSISQQDIRYMFNANNQTDLQLYTSNIISNPNNHNVEDDILETLNMNNDNPKYYEDLYNIPSINGVDIFHPRSYHLGLIETPNEEIIKMFDKVWRKEASSNPLFPMSHIDGLNLLNGKRIMLHCKYSNKDSMYILYATGVTDQFFTFYISKKSNGKIDDIQNTLKIIPFIRTGVFVYLDKSYQGRWLCCTHPNVKSIRIM